MDRENTVSYLRAIFNCKALRARRVLRLAVLLGLAAASAVAQGPSYDIAYLWHPDQVGVAAYKAKVSGIMGPDVARQLRLVRAGGKYGLGSTCATGVGIRPWPRRRSIRVF